MDAPTVRAEKIINTRCKRRRNAWKIKRQNIPFIGGHRAPPQGKVWQYDEQETKYPLQQLK